MDDRSASLARYETLRSAGEQVEGAKLDVSHEKLDRKLAEYIRTLPPFVRNVQVSGNPLVAAGELDRGLPEMRGKPQQRARLLAIINDFIHSAPVDGPIANFLVRVEAGPGPLTANTLPKPKETTTVLSLDTVRVMQNACTLQPAVEAPPLDDMSVAAGMLIISQRESTITNRLHDNNPFTEDGGPSMYGSRNRDPIMLNSADNIDPIGLPWPEFLFRYPQFIPLYHQLYPGDPRVNFSNDQEWRTDDEDARMISEKDAAAIASEVAVAAVEARRKSQEREAEVQGARGEEGLRTRREEGERHLREENEHDAGILREENERRARRTGAETRIEQAERRVEEAGPEARPGEAAAAKLAVTTAVAETEVMTPEGPQRPETAPIAEGAVETAGATKTARPAETTTGKAAPSESGISAETVAFAAEPLLQPATGGQNIAPAAAQAGQNEVANQAARGTAGVETGEAVGQAAAPERAAEVGRVAGAPGPTETPASTTQSQPVEGEERPGPQQQQSESSLEASQRAEQEVKQRQTREPEQPSERVPEREDAHRPEQPEPEESRAEQTREKDAGAERENARGERADSLGEEADGESSNANVAGFIGAESQSATYYGGGLAAHGMMHAAMHQGTVQPTEAGYAVAYAAAVPKGEAAAAAAIQTATIRSPAGQVVGTAHVGAPAALANSPLSAPQAVAATKAAATGMRHGPLTTVTTMPVATVPFVTAKAQPRTKSAKSTRASSRRTAWSKSATPRERLMVKKKLAKAKTQNPGVSASAEATAKPAPSAPTLDKG